MVKFLVDWQLFIATLK